MRQFCEAVALIRNFNGHVRLSDCWQILVRLLVWVRIYQLGAKTSSTCPVVADRMSMPRKDAVVLLDDWLPPSLVSAWNHPECEASKCSCCTSIFRREHGRMEGPLQTHASELPQVVEETAEVVQTFPRSASRSVSPTESSMCQVVQQNQVPTFQPVPRTVKISQVQFLN